MPNKELQKAFIKTTKFALKEFKKLNLQKYSEEDQFDISNEFIGNLLINVFIEIHSKQQFTKQMDENEFSSFLSIYFDDTKIHIKKSLELIKNINEIDKNNFIKKDDVIYGHEIDPLLKLGD